MPERFRRPLNETLGYLLQLRRESVAPREALARLRALQERCPEVELDLAWQEEGFAREVDYQALLHLPGEGTLSLGFSPERAVPWALRGAQHSREREVLRVDQWRFSVADVMVFLDFIWERPGIIRALVDQALIALETARRALEPSDAELQRAMDRFRSERRLRTAAATLRWLEEHGMTHAALERKLAEELRAGLLRERLAEGKVEEYFDRHRETLDTLVLARFSLPDEPEARETYEAIRAGKTPFLAAAQAAFLADGGPAALPLFTRVRRWDLPPDRTALLFGMQPGEVTAPAPRGGRFELVQVLQLEPAVLDVSTRERVKDALLAEWLEGRRAEAEIEWFWGELPASSPRGGDSFSP